MSSAKLRSPPNPSFQRIVYGDALTSNVRFFKAIQRAYLSRLVCLGGETPTYKRIGNFGGRTDFPKNLSPKEEQILSERVMRGDRLQPREPDYHIVDGYEVSCGQVKRMLFLDMYHRHQPAPTAAPNGFTLR